MLYAWADLGYAEIAEALGIPIGTVRSRIRARDCDPERGGHGRRVATREGACS